MNNTTGNASIPIMITAAQRQRLVELGCTTAQINAMTPSEAHAILNASPNGTHPPIVDDEIANLLDEARIDPSELNAPGPSLLDGLASCDGDTGALQRFALDNLDALADMNRGEFARFCNELTTRGVPSEWVRRELKPVVNDERRKEQAGITWTHYVDEAERLGHAFALNELDDRVEVNGERLSDVAEARLLSYLHAKGLRNADVARRAFVTAAAQNRYHPVKRYLQSLEWDGRNHIAYLAKHFSDNHSPIIYSDGTQRSVIHAWLLRWLVGSVAKVVEAGRVQNPMLILDGAQGKGKSYFAKWICPLPELHFEGAIRPEDKDYLGYLTTRWVWEVSELGATMRKADQEALKSFVTLQDATYRPSYGRHPLYKPAMASFIGTVNFDGALLSDHTGHRRFHPVELTAINWDYSNSVDVDQVWAQAYALYHQGEPWRLTNEEHQAQSIICERYSVEDVLAGYVMEWFDIQPDNKDMYTHTTEIIDHLRTYAGMKGDDRALAMRLAGTLDRLKLHKTKRDNRWGYVGITTREAKQG